MANESLIVGNSNWAVKANNLLGYAVGETSGYYVPRELDFTRNSTATYTDENGIIQTAAANIARVQDNALLLEPQRTNLVPNANGYAGNSVYYTITPNQSSPDGSNNAVLFVEKTSTSPYSINSVSATILPNTQYTYSFFVKYAGIQFIPINASDGLSGFGATFDALNGVMSSGAGTVQQYQDGWYRVSLTRTSGATANTGLISHNFGLKTGDGVSGFYLFGNQIEASSYATSYIPTTSAAVTRLADQCSKTGISSLIGQSEGTMFIEMASLTNSVVSNYFSISDGTYTNRASILFSSGTNFIRSFLRVNSISQFDRTATGLDITEMNKIAFAYKQNDFAMYVNGVLIEQSNAGDTFNPNTLSIVSFSEIGSGTGQLNARVNQATLFKTRLSNTQLAELTTL
jgi:hypothetical protein